MISQFHRTSTFRVLEASLYEKTTDGKIIQNYINSQGHNRKLSDVKLMINHLIDVGLLGNVEGSELVELMLQIEPQKPTQQDVYIANRLISFLNNEGLAISPFLEATKIHPNNSSWIQIETIKQGKKYGYNSLREGQDVVSAMGNFASFVGLLKPRQKGRYELSKLGEMVLSKNEVIISERIKCDQNEPCRIICPTNAITINKINMASCIECALCTYACPYGALDLKCEKVVSINLDLCQSNSGNTFFQEPCDPKKITVDEISMQRWICSLLRSGHLNSEIPGPGEYPDIVTKEIPSFLEVKKRKISDKKIDTFAKQVLRYQESDIIDKTIVKLDNKEFKAPYPIKFVYIAPSSNSIPILLQTIRDENPPLPVSFISYETMYKISQTLLKGKTINFFNIWNNLEPWLESKKINLH